ncbi:MAG TPA: TonB-dependent receptor [Steroidobacteraceae bacterium]|nr:TonB-dependent receptor [Steroidobacteraceae bacterium]
MGIVNRGSCALLGAGLLGLLAEVAPAADAESGNAPKDDQQLGEIVVTGSHIASSVGMETPTPVTALSADELQALSPSTLISALSQLPQFYGNTTNDVRTGFFSSPGEGNLNLRGLNTGGSGRTLTLLDGRRVVPATGYGSVDINILPQALIKRVDTVTGGASAAYGTDAVAGAVNFILDTKYDGWQLGAQGGTTGRGDHDNTDYSGVFGTQLGERAHLLLSGEYYHADRVDSYADRGWYKGYALINNPSTDPASPRYVTRPDVVSSIATFGGLINSGVPTTSALYRRYFQPDGTLAPFVPGDGTATSAQSILNGGSGDDTTADLLDLAPEAQRGNAFLYLDYDATPNLNLYVQGLAGQSMVDQRDHGGRFANVPGIDTHITIYRENPYLPAAVAQIMDSEGLTSFQMNLVGDREGLGRDSHVEQDNHTYSGTTGFKWEIAQGALQGWHVDGYAQYGTADNKGYQTGLVIDHFLAAVDAVADPAHPGQVVCHAALVDPARYGNCVPLDLFGRGNASAAAIAYATQFTAGQKITAPLFFQPDGYASGQTVDFTSGTGKVYNTTTTQKLAELSTNGKVVDGWAGPIATAFGVTYRKEEIEQIVYDPSNPASDPNILPAGAALNPDLRGVPSYFATRSSMIQNSTVANVHGSYDVKEVFNEWQVPLLTGLTAARQLSLLAAARYADYQGSGGVWSWKTGLDWQVVDDVRLRGTVSRDLRAATLLERYNQTGGAGSIQDPYEGGMTHAVSTRTGGNPDLDPETSRTYTYGVVFQPHWLTGFSTSVDYWDVDISGAIGTLGLQRIVDACHADSTSSTCGLITFDPATGYVAQVRNISQNIAAAAGRGVDVELDYRHPVRVFRDGGENLGLRVFWSHLMEDSTTADRSNPSKVPPNYVDAAGQVGLTSLPDDSVTAELNYGLGPLGVTLSARFIGNGINNVSYNLPAATRPDIDDNTVGSVTYLNLSGSYSWDLHGGKLQLYAEIQNLLDRDPPVVPALFDASLVQTGNGGTNAGLYDLLGRRFTLGVKFRH